MCNLTFFNIYSANHVFQEGVEVEFNLPNRQRVQGKARRNGTVKEAHYQRGAKAPYLYTISYLENGQMKTIDLNPAWVRPVPMEVSRRALTGINLQCDMNTPYNNVVNVFDTNARRTRGCAKSITCVFHYLLHIGKTRPPRPFFD